MEDFFSVINQGLNNLAGLFSLLAVLAAVIVPIVLYKKGRKNERQAMQDELDAMNANAQFPMSENEREFYIRKTVLEKRSKK